MVVISLANDNFNILISLFTYMCMCIYVQISEISKFFVVCIWYSYIQKQVLVLKQISK